MLAQQHCYQYLKKNSHKKKTPPDISLSTNAFLLRLMSSIFQVGSHFEQLLFRISVLVELLPIVSIYFLSPNQSHVSADVVHTRKIFCKYSIHPEKISFSSLKTFIAISLMDVAVLEFFFRKREWLTKIICLQINC